VTRGCVHQGGDQAGHRAQVLIQPDKFDGLGVDAGMIARPFFKIAVFRAAGLNGFDHFNAGNRSGGKLARIARLHPGKVDALMGLRRK